MTETRARTSLGHRARATKAEEEADSKDVVRSKLEEWAREAAREARNLRESIARKETTLEADDLNTLISFADQRRKFCGLLGIAADQKRLWGSIEYAIHLGIFLGIDQSFPYTSHAKRKLSDSERLRLLSEELRLKGPRIAGKTKGEYFKKVRNPAIRDEFRRQRKAHPGRSIKVILEDLAGTKLQLSGGKTVKLPEYEALRTICQKKSRG